MAPGIPGELTPQIEDDEKNWQTPSEEAPTPIEDPALREFLPLERTPELPDVDVPQPR